MMSAHTDSSLDELALILAQGAIEAARSGNMLALKQLLDRGVPVDVRSSQGDSLLMLACYHGHALAAELLLARGADPELANDRGQTPLQGVAYKGDLSVLRVLLTRARVDGGGPDGKTPLMFAAMFNRVEVAKLLLAHGADRAKRDAVGATAGALAQAMGAHDTYALLAE